MDALQIYTNGEYQLKKNDQSNMAKKIDEFYPDLKDSDEIESFALLGYEEGRPAITVSDFNLTNDEKKIFSEVSNIYTDFNTIKKLYYMYQRDLEQFNSHFNDVEEGKVMKKLNDHTAQHDFDRFLVHILSSSRLFITYFENSLIREYGKDSWQFKKWDKLTSKIYDTYFEYRFSYHLRNYTQHRGLPISTITTTLTDDDSQRFCTCEIMLNAQNLLDSNYNWKKIIRDDLNEIKNNNENIDLVELLNSHEESMNIIYDIANEIFAFSHYEKLARLEKKLRKIYSSTSKEALIYKTTKYNLKNNGNNGIGDSWKPLDGLKEILEMYLVWDKRGYINLNLIAE